MIFQSARGFSVHCIEKDRMIRVTHLFMNSGSTPASEQYIRETYIPMLEALPGAVRLEAARVSEAPLGPSQVGYVLDQYFADADAMHRAMASAAGGKLARELMAGSASGIEMIVSEVIATDRTAQDAPPHAAADLDNP